MKLTLDQLQTCFRNNFVTYFISHVAHVNIMGRNFVSDHKLLKGVYEQRQAEIDRLAEFIRTLNGFMIDQLQAVLVDATIEDGPTRGDADQLLAQVRAALTDLADDFRDLREVADEEELDNIANYADEQVTALSQKIWFISSTLGEDSPVADTTAALVAESLMES